jgi:hypothetical protein
VIDWGMVNQARDGIRRLIEESPESVVFYRSALVDDGFGGQTPDPTGAKVAIVSQHVRISHQNAVIPDFTSVPPGLSTNLSRYVLCDYRVDIETDDTFSAFGRGWRVGAVDVLKKFGEVIGYQAPLIEAEDVGVNT